MKTTHRQRSHRGKLLTGLVFLFVICGFSGVVAKPMEEAVGREKDSADSSSAVSPMFDPNCRPCRLVVRVLKITACAVFIFFLPAIICGPPLFCYGAVCEWRDHFDVWPPFIVLGASDIFAPIPHEHCVCASLNGERRHGVLAFWQHFVAACDFGRLCDRDLACQMAQEEVVK